MVIADKFPLIKGKIMKQFSRLTPAQMKEVEDTIIKARLVREKIFAQPVVKEVEVNDQILNESNN